MESLSVYTVSQLSAAQNTYYAKVACFGVAYSLQYIKCSTNTKNYYHIINGVSWAERDCQSSSLTYVCVFPQYQILLE